MLAAGVPIVVSPLCGVPEIVEDGQTGLLVRKPGDSRAFVPPLTALLSDPHLRHALARRGRAACEVVA